MSRFLLFCITIMIAVFATPLWSAEEGDADNKTMQIEKIIAECEEQFKEEDYPDVDELNKLIDECIDARTGSGG